MFKKITLKNGLRIITIPQKNVKAVTVLILVGTGSKYENQKINGISHFLEHLLFKGTEKRPDQTAISEPLDSVGGIYNAFTGEEYTGFFAKVEARHFNLALDVLSDIFLNSKLKPEDVEKERGVIIEEINMYYDHPSYYVQNLWTKVLYGDQPAGWDIAGTKETVSKISRDDLANYIKSQYAASNTLICVAGRIDDEKKATKEVERYFKKTEIKKPFGKIPVIDASVNSASTLSGRRRVYASVNSASTLSGRRRVEKQIKPEIILQKRETDQTHFCLGVRGYDIFHRQKYAFEILADILGGMMSSRLFIKIREELGAAYHISTSSASFTDTGFLVTQAGVDNKKIDQTISAVLEEYKKISKEEIPAKELKKAKDHIKGKMALLLETSDAQASFYGMQELLEKDILTPEEIFKKIDEVTVEDVLKVAGDIFKENKLNLSIIGPYDNEERFVKLLHF